MNLPIYFNSLGSLCGCPFMNKAKQDPFSLATAGASILGSILGSGSNASANATNAQIARENMQLQRETNEQNAALQREANAQNYKMFKEQNAFNEEMWNKANDYNDPRKVAQRLLAAGINPAFAFGSQADAGAVSSAGGSAAQAPNLVAPQNGFHQVPYDPRQGFTDAASAVLQALNWKSNSELSKSQANYNNVKAQNEAMQGIADLAQKMQNYKKGSVEYEQLKTALELQKRTIEDSVTQMHNLSVQGAKNVEKTELDIQTAKIQNSILQVDAKWKEKLTAAQLRAMDYGIKQTLSAIRLNDSNAAMAHANAAVAAAQKQGLDIDNKQKEQLVDAIVNQAYFETDKRRYEAGNERKRYYGGRIGYEAPRDGFTDNGRYRVSTAPPEYRR